MKIIWILILLAAAALHGVELAPGAARLWPCGERTATLRPEPAAPYGEVIHQPAGGGSDWSIQWNNFDFATLDDGEEYELSVLARSIAPAGDGPAFQVGIWNAAASGNALHRVVTTGELDPNEWRWIPIGSGALPRANAVLYAGPVVDATPEAVEIAAVRFISVAEKRARLSDPMYRDGSAWRNALAPAGTPRLFRFAADGEAACDLVLAATATPQERHAAELLQTWGKRIFGVPFPIVAEAGSRPAIRFVTDPACGETGYAIRAEGDDLILSGGIRRGPVNAVFALLTEDLGCRNYARYDLIRHPRIADGQAAVVPRAYTPSLKMRDPHIWEAFSPEWALWNRTNAGWNAIVPVSDDWGGMQGHPRELFAHTFEFLIPPDPYFTTHPEYFPLVDGKRIHHQAGVKAAQLCLTNPEIAAIAADRIRGVLRANPNAGYVSISQNDGDGGWCECADCAALLEREGSLSGPVLHFVNQVAGLLRDEFPQVQFSTLAYLETVQAPAVIRPADNVVIWLATDSHIWAHPYRFLTETETFRRAFDAWLALGVRPLIWDYTFGDNGNWMTPVPNLEVMDTNFRYLTGHGISGMFFQGNFQSPGTSRGALVAWVQAQLLWNPDLPLEALVEDFTVGFYGPAATTMQRYNQALEGYWENYHRTQGVDAKLEFTPAFLAELRAILAEAKAACAEAPEFLPFIEREEASVLYAVLTTPPATEAEMADYRADLARFVELAQRFGVTHLSEGGDMAQKLLSFRRNAGRLPDSAPGTVELPLEAARLWPCGEATAVWAIDGEAGAPVAIRQPTVQSTWAIQWSTPVPAALTPGTRHRLLVELKAQDVRDATAPLLSIGWWDYATGSHRLLRQVRTDELSPDGYTWIDAGEIVLPAPGENTVLYLAPASGAGAGAYWLNAVKFVAL